MTSANKAAQKLSDLGVSQPDQIAPLFAEVQPMAAFRGATPLLRRDPAYAEVYRMWLALRQHPKAFDLSSVIAVISDAGIARGKRQQIDPAKHIRRFFDRRHG